MAAIAAVGDDAGEARADLRFDLRDHSLERVAVVGVARQRLDVGDKLAALRPVQRGRDRHLDAELVGAMGLALADAFDLGRVQRIDLRSALVLALMAHAEGEPQRFGEDLAQARIVPGFAHDVAEDSTQIGPHAAQRPVGALELLGQGWNAIRSGSLWA